MTYDSRFEQRIAPQLEALGFVRCTDYFQQDGDVRQFHDKEGARFSAKPDFWHPKLDLYIETKAGTLNSKTRVRTAANAEAHRRDHCRIRGKAFNVGDMYATQFSHSRYKQSAVQRALTPQSVIVVFAERVPYATMTAYAKVGMVAIHLDALPQYLHYIQFTRYGLPVSWNLPYPEHGSSFVLH
ncbi:hypothetical protein [Cupriavidus plantarum]|uniref:Uncharacterized protein n=1 Tax=Cupriavidus plantarum TaxID=942865 RepID=A0A316F1C7_9BURK|nr:hypothetical protein [Cupriavidus plantarum]PWK38674.1 hypothetical protein C7419_1012573 [Cupriavidus plantarum]